MARDPLAVVLRLRRLAREDAARELAFCLERQARMEAAVSAIRNTIATEQEQVSRPEAGDLAVEAFGRWLRRVRVEMNEAEVSLERAVAETARGRAVLAAAGKALAAAETLAEERAEEQRRGRLASEQAAIDEAAQRRRK